MAKLTKSEALIAFRNLFIATGASTSLGHFLRISFRLVYELGCGASHGSALEQISYSLDVGCMTWQRALEYIFLPVLSPSVYRTAIVKDRLPLLDSYTYYYANRPNWILQWSFEFFELLKEEEGSRNVLLLVKEESSRAISRLWIHCAYTLLGIPKHEDGATLTAFCTF